MPNPSSNVLIALRNILINQSKTLPTVIDHYSNNRINGVGDLLEYYVKDAFCDRSSSLEKTNEKLSKYQQVFSYLGNSNNPPDFIIKNGAAVEVKKIEKVATGSIALNSSFPKNYLYSSDSKIKQSCRDCENEYGGWEKKDMIYAIGNVTNENLHSLWLVYGDCFCADKESYEIITETMKNGVNDIPGVQFSETKELGRINRVDPLGITYLRIRGMWGIEHPANLFSEYLNTDSAYTKIYVLMRKSTYIALDAKPDLTQFINQGILTVNEIQIPNPDNPAQNIDAILYSAAF
ncbi:NgoPII family restriction endonuclease [Metabacillus fastidiosus]|uniref:NgoPII family restriction endonuclease n=1 Tax=Metabacillus fastidiosus TaxID=1458 RepID=UPI003D2E7E62